MEPLAVGIRIVETRISLSGFIERIFGLTLWAFGANVTDAVRVDFYNQVVASGTAYLSQRKVL